MQRSSTVLVQRMNVGACVEKATDGLHLPFGVPRGTADETVNANKESITIRTETA